MIQQLKCIVYFIYLNEKYKYGTKHVIDWNMIQLELKGIFWNNLKVETFVASSIPFLIWDVAQVAKKWD